MDTVSAGPETERGNAGGGSLALGTVDLLVSLLGLFVLAGAYRVGLLPEVLALLLLIAAPVTAVSRAWRARGGGLEYGLLRRPFRRELRAHLAQCLNQWLLWALVGAAIIVGTFANVPGAVAIGFGLPLPELIPYRPLVVVLGVAAFATAVLALVPRRRVQVATNVLAAICSAFLAVQLARIHTPPADPVALDSPLCGEWAMLAGGRSSLLSHHYPHTQVRDAVDFVRLVNGRAHDGDATREESWYGFGEPVLAPIDGTVVRTFDLVPDEPVAAVGQTPSEGNHVVLDIGEGRYAVLAHLRQGSVRVSVGEQVRRGQQIAAIGDSGDSLAPHLHLQVQNGPHSGEHVATVPIVFRDVVLIRNGVESTPAGADLRRGDRIRPVLADGVAGSPRSCSTEP
jgi:Peptidase family M23